MGIRAINAGMMVASPGSGLSARILSVFPLRDVRAGSALIWHEGRLLVVQDDAASAVWVDPSSGQTERLVLEGTGEPLEKSRKPDFEVAFVGPGRTVTILGSGSSPRRRRAAVVDLDTHAVRIVDHARLFEALEQALGVVPNLEGGVIWRGHLRVLHRGAGGDKSAVVDVSLAVLDGAEPQILGLTFVDLGRVHDVPLHFTDAAVWGESIVYLAVAEDTPNAIDDGPVVGAAVGFLEGNRVIWTPLCELSGEISTRKVEGIAIVPSTGMVYCVTDPDDPDKPAELLTIEIVQSRA